MYRAPKMSRTHSNDCFVSGMPRQVPDVHDDGHGHSHHDPSSLLGGRKTPVKRRRNTAKTSTKSKGKAKTSTKSKSKSKSAAAKIKPLQKWNKHLAAFRKSHPDLSMKEAMQGASKTYVR